MNRHTIYVAPTGSDTASGTRESPFASIVLALEHARMLQRRQPQVKVEVVLRGGVYRLDKTVEIGSFSGGQESGGLTVRNETGERVIMKGSVPLRSLREIDDVEIMTRLSPEQQESIRYCLFSEVGVSSIEAIKQRGQPPIELYADGERLPLSRYPREGWLHIEDVPQDGVTRLHEGLDRERRFHGVPIGRHYGRIIYPGARPEDWDFHREIFMHGYWTWDWNDSYQTIDHIDASERSVHLASPHHSYGYTTNQRFAFLNVLEEIDRPGTWCFHRQTGRIYIWPLENSDAGYEVAVLRDPILSVRNCTNVDIVGIDFVESLGRGVEVRNSSQVRVLGCSFARLGDTAIECTGVDNQIASCDLFDLGGGGISVDGGDRRTLRSGNNRVENNHIHDFSRWIATYKHAISVDGVGNAISHNLIHHAPHEAMVFRGNDHLIEFNEIHTVTTETGDSGAIHTGRDWTWRDTILRYNLIHHLSGAGLHGVMGIYLDDFMSSTTIYGNIFHHAGRAAFVGGGRDNIIANNLFFECRASVHVDARGTSWAAYYFDGTYPVLFEAMDAVSFRESPYAERYPELLRLYDDDPARPKGNQIRGNISTGGLWLELRDTVRIDDLVHERNYISDEVVCEQLRPELDEDPYFLDIDQTDPYQRIQIDDSAALESLIEAGNMVASPTVGTEVVPGWRDRDFTVDETIAEAVGFTQIPFQKIGLYVDEYRSWLPTPQPLSDLRIGTEEHSRPTEAKRGRRRNAEV